MRKGFAFFHVLIIFAITLISLTYINYLVTLEKLIDISYEDKIQSDLLAESKINRVFYEDFYYKGILEPWIIKDLNNNTSKLISMDVNHLDLNDSYKFVSGAIIDYKTSDHFSRKYLELKTEARYKGITTSIKSSGPIVEDIFEVGNLPIISSETSAALADYYNIINNELKTENISDQMQVFNIFDYDDILLKYKDSTNNELIRSRNEAVCGSSLFISNKYIFLIIRNTMNKPIKFNVGDKINFDKITYSGIMYLEGDLEVSTNFDFNGILILKGENSKVNINPDCIFKFRGIILTQGTTDYVVNMDLVYDRGYIYRYGVYLPGFLNPRLVVTKKF